MGLGLDNLNETGQKETLIITSLTKTTKPKRKIFF